MSPHASSQKPESALPPMSPEPAAPPAPTSLDVASAIVRGWTHLYTLRVDPRIRDARRAEIVSDLWEFQHDPERGKFPVAHVIARLLIGIPDDLSWRAEHAATRRTRLRTGLRFAAWAVATVIVAAAIWILPLMTTATLPPLPDKPRVAMRTEPPPPLPPPPPCAPAGFPQSRPCTP